MSHTSDSRKGANKNSDEPNVIQLGLNISVAGKSGSDFEIYVNDKKQSCGQLRIPDLEQITQFAGHLEDQKCVELTGEKIIEEYPLDKLSASEVLSGNRSHRNKNEKSPSTAASGEGESSKSSRSEDVRIIDEIKNAMGNFEKFSEHLREIPRLSTKRMCTSTPFPDRNNSRSEGNLSLYGNVPRSYIPKHDFRDRKYLKKTKPLSKDLFLKPLPAEDYFKKGFVRRYYDIDSYHHYSSMDNLPHYYEYGGEWKNSGKATSKSDNDKSDALSSASDVCASETKALSKKGDGNDAVDKRSTSSESTKDIKIYQSGGIIIMQNFRDSADLIDKDLADGIKVIENSNKLKGRMERNLHDSDESQKLLLNSSPDDVKGQSTKFVQFDLSSCENNGSKSCDSSSDMPKSDLQTMRSELSKGKDSGIMFPPHQDFTSLSTQENDSISNIFGMSPTSSTSGKKLEWDSGADVGYLNSNLRKENISTIERIILRGLSDDGNSKSQIICQRNDVDVAFHPSKFIEEGIPSELEIEVRNSSTSKRSSSDQSSVPNGVATGTATSHNLNNEEPVFVSITHNSERKESEDIPKRKVERFSKPCTTKKSRHSKKSKLVKSSEDTKLANPEKTFDETKKKETSYNVKATTKEEKFVQTPKVDTNKEVAMSSDKSTYVNTLFDDFGFELPLQDLSRSEESGRSESSDRFGPNLVASPRVKKFKKKKNIPGSNSLSQLKGRIETVIDIAEHSDESDNRQKLKQTPVLSEAAGFSHNSGDEKVEDVEETDKSVPTPSCFLDKVSQKDKAVRSRPISGSSSSVRTVMHNVNATEKIEVKNFSDQIIQTSELTYESKGIQAFQSAKCSAASSQIGEDMTKNGEEMLVDIGGVEILREKRLSKSILACSKSIQAPGMNSSLPKHLAHPKQTISCDQMNTKSTQFFGGLITSLPNYHSNVSLKESTVHKDKILKTNTDSNTEKNNRSIQENVKNVFVENPNEKKVVVESRMSNAASKSIEEGTDIQLKRLIKGTKMSKNNVEDKENISVDEEELHDYSVRQSNSCRKEFITSCSVNSESRKSDSMAFGSCEVFPSDDGKNVFLTSELLKEHGDRIDRNIIQEKYFQSQLLELERREMVSRSTYMEKKSENERNTQTSFSPTTGVAVSCQYSLMNESEELIFYSKTDFGKSTKKNEEIAWTDQNSRDECDSSQKRKNGNPFNTLDDDIVLAESLSSDTQTANSWVPGMQKDSENQLETELRLEYSPEHIYDDPLSLKEKLYYGNENNVLMGDTEQSNGTYSASATNSRVKNSESGHTLVLENTDEMPLEIDKMKRLDNNLTELEMVVSKLHEKEAVFQKITDSVLSTVSKGNGSGDSSHNQKERNSLNDNSKGSEEISCEIEVLEENNNSNWSGRKNREVRDKINEVSTACQTDTMKPDPNRSDGESKQREQKMNDEKELQIKWIENEIKHLNMLRSLLEEQEHLKNSTGRKKRHHYLTETSEARSATATLKEEILRKILTNSFSETSSAATEVHNADRSKLETPLFKLTGESTAGALKQFSGSFATTSQYPQLGMAFSLRKIDKSREVTTLPVGIQVTLRDKKERSNASTSSGNVRDSSNAEQPGIRVTQTPVISTLDFGRHTGTRSSSLNNKHISTTPTVGSTDSMNRCGCFKCNKSKCVCLKTSETSDTRRSTRSSSRQSKTHEPAGGSPTIDSRELPDQGLKIPEIRNIADSRRGSTNGSPSREVTRSSKQEPSFGSLEGSLSFEKCVCICHAQPLPRCDRCHLLNTCKNCQCYRRIKCCLCEISASKVSIHKKCLSVSTSCRCKVDPCQICRCSRVKNQSAICLCHMIATSEASCKFEKTYKERSCQTEGKECSCCQRSEPIPNESDLYRETKYMSEKIHVTEKRKPSDFVYPAEQRFECESKQPVDEKFPYQMKVPVENKTGTEVINATQTKNELEKLNADGFQLLPVKELQEKKQCRCNSRQTRARNFDDHPRHYFLEVEETTEEESSESCENGNTLEVITIKVPLRKVWNGGRNTQSSPQRNSCKTKENGDIKNKYSAQKMMEIPKCNCCEDCVGHSRKRFPPGEPPQTAGCSPPNTSYESKKRPSKDKEVCGCCEDCPGRAKLEERPRPEFAICDDYEQRKTKSMSYTKFNVPDVNECCRNCCNAQNNKPLKYPSDEHRYQETETDFSGVCNCCDCCGKADDSVTYNSQNYSSEIRENETSANQSDAAEFSSTTEKGSPQQPRVKTKYHQSTEVTTEKNHVRKSKSDKCKKEKDKIRKVHRKSPSPTKRSQPYDESKNVKGAAGEKSKDKSKSNDYYNFNKKEYMTKSELEREEKKKRPTRLTLQECLTVKRPDVYTRAECRRKIISEKSKDRAERHNKRMECLTKLLPQCDVPTKNPDLKLFTSAQMKKQTRKFYKKLPEVANKKAEEKKKMQFRTNKLMAEIFAKKLQLQTLNGRLNMSNSFTVMSTM